MVILRPEWCGGEKRRKAKMRERWYLKYTWVESLAERHVILGQPNRVLGAVRLHG